MNDRERTKRHMTEIVDQAILMCDMLGEEKAILYCENMGVSRSVFERVFSDPSKRRPFLKSITEIMDDINKE